MSKIITIILFTIGIMLVGCESGTKTVEQDAVKEFFFKNRVGSSPDYAVMKNGTDHLLTVHGFVNDLDVCMKLIEPYNNNPSLSTLPGSYTCVPLNK
jgi:hypothetical protein